MITDAQRLAHTDVLLTAALQDAMLITQHLIKVRALLGQLTSEEKTETGGTRIELET